MSLRVFHLFFIALSVVLAAFFAAWAAGQYSAGHEISYVIVGVLSLASGLGLAVYAVKFQRNTRSM